MRHGEKAPALGGRRCDGGVRLLYDDVAITMLCLEGAELFGQHGKSEKREVRKRSSRFGDFLDILPKVCMGWMVGWNGR